jgi:hypothetical protein
VGRRSLVRLAELHLMYHATQSAGVLLWESLTALLSQRRGHAPLKKRTLCDVHHRLSLPLRVSLTLTSEAHMQKNITFGSSGLDEATKAGIGATVCSMLLLAILFLVMHTLPISIG